MFPFVQTHYKSAFTLLGDTFGGKTNFFEQEASEALLKQGKQQQPL